VTTCDTEGGLPWKSIAGSCASVSWVQASRVTAICRTGFKPANSVRWQALGERFGGGGGRFLAPKRLKSNPCASA
jgi:hypothetical protein